MPRKSAKSSAAHTSAIRSSATKPSLHSQTPEDPLTFICSACRAGPFSREGFRQAFDDPDTGYRYMTTWGKISQSISKQSCSWCHILRRTRDGLPPEIYPPPDEENVEVRFRIYGWDSDSGLLDIYLNGYQHQAATYSMLRVYGSSHVGSRTVRKAPYVDYSTALEYIKLCSTYHEHCPTIEETYLPTRVIDCLDPSKPRLVETNRQIRGHYCALSYVWGGEQHQKTTTSNIDIYIRDGINIPLPQTITDAILATNKLGIRYLWVDAMCIIQDSMDDKANELAIMANIYCNAYVMIASSAYRADHGFLPDERPPDVLPFLQASGSKRKLPGWVLLEENLKSNLIHYSLPSDKRGWCLQETVLSPRRLIFRPPFVEYECRSFYKSDVRKPCHGSTTIATSDEELLYNWEKIIMDYTRRKITVPSDKLVALASIAEVFQSALKDQYIAGLWRRSLLGDLLWTVSQVNVGSLQLRPLCYRAPTWSWASIDGPVIAGHQHNPTYSTSYEADILACEVTLRNSVFPLGEITDARLTMKVKMLPLTRDGKTCSLTDWMEGQRRIEGIPAPEIMFDCLDCLEGTEQDHQMNFYVIILRAGTRQSDFSLYYAMEGLIVVPVDGKADQYRRVAKLDSRYALRWPDWFDAMPFQTVALV